ncbi:hypothetical protein D9M68_918350 [compost metagenome]
MKTLDRLVMRRYSRYTPGNTQKCRHYAITALPPVNTGALMPLRHSVVKDFEQIVNEGHIREMITAADRPPRPDRPWTVDGGSRT